MPAPDNPTQAQVTPRTSDTTSDSSHRTLRERVLRAFDARSPYVFIAPFFLLFLAFQLFPLGYTAYVSLFDWDLIGDSTFHGSRNYELLMSDPLFWRSVANTFSIWFIGTVPQLMLALVLAVVLNERMLRGRTFFQMGLLLPNITSTVAVAIIFTSIFGRDYGVLNYGLSLVGLDPIAWANNRWSTHVAIGTMIMWRWTGYNALIYLAGMQSLSREVFEAAKVDGASRLQSFIHITIPLLRPIILFTVIMSTVGGMQTFAEPLLFSGVGGGSGAQGLTMTLYMYEEAFRNFSFGYASAIAWVMFLIIALLVLVNLLLTRRISTKD